MCRFLVWCILSIYMTTVLGTPSCQPLSSVLNQLIAVHLCTSCFSKIFTSELWFPNDLLQSGFLTEIFICIFLSCMLPFTLSSLSQFNPKYMLIPHLFNVYDNTHFLYPKNDPGYLFQVFRLKSWSVGISDRRNSCYLPRPSPSVHCTTR